MSDISLSALLRCCLCWPGQSCPVPGQPAPSTQSSVSLGLIMRTWQWKLWQILIIATLLSQVSSYESFLSAGWYGDVFMNHGCLFTQRDPYDCCRALGKRLIESSAFVCVSCVLYLSNNANGNEYQNCDFGEGGHWEDCFGRKIPERWVPWPHCTPGHNCGILRIKVLRLEQLCFWQTNFFVLSCRTLDIDGREVKLGVWDTAGSERYDTITRMYYR